MLERFIQDLRTDDPGREDPAATRERLRTAFAPGATRRMTQLGLLVGATLGPLEPTEDDAVVYASSYGESRALESFLESFPFPSPTLFQTSIHPSGVQQGLIGRQRTVRELLPIAGDRHLAGQALLVALLSPAPRVLLCGGEERGTWLLEHGVASDRTFAFALALTRTPGAAALGRVTLAAGTQSGALPLAAWFDCLHRRHPWSGAVADGWHLNLTWS
jgi:hypothetical protein